MTETYLEHHGVKGMKWGVRKDRTLTYEQKKKIAKNPSKLKKYKDQFSKRELTKAIKDLETDYKLSNMSQRKIDNGKKNFLLALGLTGVAVTAGGFLSAKGLTALLKNPNVFNSLSYETISGIEKYIASTEAAKKAFKSIIDTAKFIK